MTPQEAISFYGSGTKLARATGVTDIAVSLWKTRGAIPKTRQYQIQVLTKGKLKAGIDSVLPTATE